MRKNILYDKFNNEIEISNFKYYDEGMCAKIFKENNLILKVYKVDCSYRYILSRRMFSMLQDLNLSNVVKLYNYYYLEYRKHHILPMDAYSMEYVPGNKSILNQDKNYLLNSMYILENTCLTLAKNKIEINDSHASNIIFNDMGATLIDVDIYSVNKLKSISKIFTHNKEEILNALKNRIKSEILEQELEVEYYKFLYLLNIDVMHKSITEELDKILTDESLLENINNYNKTKNK